MKIGINNKNIVLCVCGGIAAYKSAEFLRLLIKQDANVRVIMTQNATEFVGPLTFEALSGQPVCTSLFEKSSDDASIKHIDWAGEADAVVIAPATANIIGKCAHGIADDALSTFLLAVKCPVLICPSMNTHMYENKAVQRNLDQLRADGFIIAEPDSGELACGTTGSGRLPEPADILDRLFSCLTVKDMKNKQVLVTAGPTREPIDPVRFISNPSSGKMGYAIARAAEQRGARVVLVTGPTNLPDPANITTVRIKTAREMAEAVFERLEQSDIVIKTAAVADYRPKSPADQKIKKGEEEKILELEKNQDILKELGTRKKDQILVGFAAETQDLEKNAGLKLAKKNLDIIAGNLIGGSNSGFEADTNQVTLFFRDGRKEPLSVMGKDEVAHIILDRVKGLTIDD
ncbi:MAG: bifunctional phosphopantothenoylcysteine decarboxylase/phosphopantothenate--cysteine ligase CoaBC [Desulfobacteraceae bacterium]|nr:bifunctional phosphopantothenoylcysteine decarboxylase/phosphopantothenate--cysteine ligase CoaBC [Desulfobacteraceae bacterium]